MKKIWKTIDLSSEADSLNRANMKDFQLMVRSKVYLMPMRISSLQDVLLIYTLVFGKDISELPINYMWLHRMFPASLHSPVSYWKNWIKFKEAEKIKLDESYKFKFDNDMGCEDMNDEEDTPDIDDFKSFLNDEESKDEDHDECTIYNCKVLLGILKSSTNFSEEIVRILDTIYPDFLLDKIGALDFEDFISKNSFLNFRIFFK